MLRNIHGVPLALLVAGLLHASPAQAEATFPSKSRRSPSRQRTTADWASTYYGVSTHAFEEATPGLRHLQHHPAWMVAAGAAEDVALTILWHRTVGRRHPKLAVAGLWAATGFRVYLASKGIAISSSRP